MSTGSAVGRVLGGRHGSLLLRRLCGCRRRSKTPLSLYGGLVCSGAAPPRMVAPTTMPGGVVIASLDAGGRIALAAVANPGGLRRHGTNPEAVANIKWQYNGCVQAVRLPQILFKPFAPQNITRHDRSISRPMPLLPSQLVHLASRIPEPAFQRIV